jgi:hypothetical protein
MVGSLSKTWQGQNWLATLASHWINVLNMCICSRIPHLLQVFLPINISESHLYLAVINARKCLIQVLDSLGTRMSQSDFTLVVSSIDFDSFLTLCLPCYLIPFSHIKVPGTSEASKKRIPDEGFCQRRKVVGSRCHNMASSWTFPRMCANWWVCWASWFYIYK